MNVRALNRGKLLAIRLALALLLLLAALSLFKGAQTALQPRYGSWDFGMTLKAADVLKHENPYSRFLREGPGEGASEAASSNGNPLGLYPMHVPSALMLLWPLTPLNWQAAKLTWLVLNLGFTFGCLFLVARQLMPQAGLQDRILIAGLFVTSLPWRVTIANGQHLIAGMFFFLLSIELANRGARAWAGVALACSLIKYTATLFLLPYFVWKRQWAPIALALALHAIMTVAVATWLGENPVRLILQSIQAATSYQVSSGVYQVNDGFIDLFAISRCLALPLAFPVTAALVGTAMTYWLALRRRGCEAMFLSLLCFWAYLAVYHRAYDAVILLIPLAFALNALRVQPVLAELVLTVVACSWIVDRFVIRFTDWLLAGENGRESIYYAAMVGLYYGTLLSMTFRQVWPSETASRLPAR